MRDRPSYLLPAPDFASLHPSYEAGRISSIKSSFAEINGLRKRTPSSAKPSGELGCGVETFGTTVGLYGPAFKGGFALAATLTSISLMAAGFRGAGLFQLGGGS